MSQTPLVTVTINGHEVRSEKGRLLIDVAEEIGVFVPRFCYHPGMKSVAVCRMCLVQVEGQRKLLPACATPVDEGMVVQTDEEQAVDAQRGMLEFLLINHPLDCPICDRAGECPLQDQTYAHGPGTSRYLEPKRSYEKALEISDLVVLDRERCVLCWRCVRFSDEVAGDNFIELVDRGAGTQILTFNDEPFNSYFSGNTIQICPVGALLSKPYRFVSRPWNLESAPSVCSYCAVGCPITNEARNDKLVRCQALPNERVNDFWICDKGRFGYHYVSDQDRLETPLLREGDGFRAASWGEATAAAAGKLGGKERVGVVAGGHVTTEDAHAIALLAKNVIGTPHVDSRIQDAGAPYDLVAQRLGVAGSTALIDDLDAASTIVWVGADPKETLPVLFLRLRKAVVQQGARLVVVSPRRTSLDAIATEVVRCGVGEEPAAISRLTGLDDRAIVCWSSASPGRDDAATVAAALDLVTASAAKFLMGVPHAGSQGLIDMGVFPTLDAGYAPASTRGRDTRAILEAAVAGELDALLIVAADPIADFPDAALARRALESNTFTVVIELFPTETVQHANVVFPSAAYAEREGTFTNLERRLQKLEPSVAAPGSATEPWKACAALARALGSDWGWRGCDDVWDSIRKNVKTHANVDTSALRQQVPSQSAVYESGFAARESIYDNATNGGGVKPVLAGPGAQYPKGYRSGAPFQTGQNWPLSWELRAFEARQRPGYVPPLLGSGGAAGASPSSVSSVAPAGAAPAADGPAAPRRFELITGRMIYDEGAMVARTAALRGIQRPPFVEMALEDATALGVGDADEVVVAGGEVEQRLKVVVGDIARGAVFVPYDQHGFRANTLLGNGNHTVEVRRA